MTEIDVAALRAAVEKATPGPWVWRLESPNGVRDLVHWHDPKFHPTNILKTTSDWPASGEDAAYIAAVNPDVLTALLDRLERAEGAVERVREVQGRWRPMVTMLPGHSGEPVRDAAIREGFFKAAAMARDELNEALDGVA